MKKIVRIFCLVLCCLFVVGCGEAEVPHENTRSVREPRASSEPEIEVEEPEIKIGDEQPEVEILEVEIGEPEIEEPEIEEPEPVISYINGHDGSGSGRSFRLNTPYIDMDFFIPWVYSSFYELFLTVVSMLDSNNLDMWGIDSIMGRSPDDIMDNALGQGYFSYREVGGPSSLTVFFSGSDIEWITFWPGNYSTSLGEFSDLMRSNMAIVDLEDLVSYGYTHYQKFSVNYSTLYELFGAHGILTSIGLARSENGQIESNYRFLWYNIQNHRPYEFTFYHDGVYFIEENEWE